MKKILFVLVMLLSSNSHAQTIDVSQLNKIDQQIHRVVYCYEIERWNQWELNSRFETGPIHEITTLLENNGFIKRRNPVRRKAQDDTKAKLILREIKLTQEVFNSCIKDLKKILKKEYVPNFSYMDQ